MERSEHRKYPAAYRIEQTQNLGLEIEACQQGLHSTMYTQSRSVVDLSLHKPLRSLCRGPFKIWKIGTKFFDKKAELLAWMSRVLREVGPICKILCPISQDFNMDWAHVESAEVRTTYMLEGPDFFSPCFFKVTWPQQLQAQSCEMTRQDSNRRLVFNDCKSAADTYCTLFCFKVMNAQKEDIPESKKQYYRDPHCLEALNVVTWD